jgi:hypothetical protein
MSTIQRNACAFLTAAVVAIVAVVAMVGLGHWLSPRLGLAAYFIFAGLGAFSAVCILTPHWRRRWLEWILPGIAVAVLSIWVGPEINAALGWAGIVLVDLILLPLLVVAAAAIGRGRRTGKPPDA